MEVAEKNEHLLRKLTQKVSVIFTKLTEKIIIEWMLTFKFYPSKTTQSVCNTFQDFCEIQEINFNYNLEIHTFFYQFTYSCKLLFLKNYCVSLTYRELL